MDLEQQLKSDFRKFLILVWSILGLPKPTRVQLDIAYYLQHGRPPTGFTARRMIEAFRGIGKSWICSAYVCWLLWRDPDEKVMVVSASKTRSDDFSIFTKKLIAEVPVLQHLAPGPDQRASNIAFDVGPARPAHAPSVKSVGITGQLTGSRATRIIADDIESLNNSATDTMRDKLLHAINEFEALILPDKEGEITFLGTPQSEESIYNQLPEKGYEIRIWPVRYLEEKKWDKYKGNLAPFITDRVLSGKVKPGDSVEPTRFSDFELLKREASYGRAGFALQFMLDTTLSDMDRYPLKVGDLVVMSVDPDVAPHRVSWASGPDYRLNLSSAGFTGDKYHKPMYISPEWGPYQGCVMAIDPSGRGKDETGYAIIKMHQGFLYLVAAGGFRDGYSEDTLRALSMLAKIHNVSEVVIETNFGDGMFEALLKPVLAKIHKCTINPDGVRNSQRKELRIIDTLEPVLNNHRLVVDPRVIEEDLKTMDAEAEGDSRRYSLFYQLTHITRDPKCLKHDDRLDALAIAVGYWVGMMSKDVETSEREARDKAMDEEIRKYLENVGAHSGEPTSMFAHYFG